MAAIDQFVATDQTGSFKTHAGYLHALSYLCGYREFQRGERVEIALRDRIRNGATYANTASRQGFDGDQLRKSLHHAWGSELLLTLSGTYAPAELQGVSNTWVAIQAYYTCYHAIQALLVTRGQARPTSHPATQRMFVDAWVSPNHDCAPWSLAAQNGGYKNLPIGHVIDEHVHPWAALDETSAIDVACKSFRTTREGAVVEARKRARETKRRNNRKEWRGQEAERLAAGRRPRKEPAFSLPQLPAAEKATVAASVRPYGVLDYLYRLRIKSQYEDSSLFVDGPETPGDSLLAFNHLSQIVRSTLLLHELFIDRIVGRQVFERVANAWINSQRNAPINPVGERLALILA